MDDTAELKLQDGDIAQLALVEGAIRLMLARQALAIDLTKREIECLQWAAVGKSEWEISQILGISEHTSEKHLLNAKAKLGAANRVQAVAEALRRGFIV